jgi:hypothetical protein
MRLAVGLTTSAGDAAPNNGMHPTADTLPVMFLQRRGAAGNAER